MVKRRFRDQRAQPCKAVQLTGDTGPESRSPAHESQPDDGVGSNAREDVRGPSTSPRLVSPGRGPPGPQHTRVLPVKAHVPPNPVQPGGKAYNQARDQTTAYSESHIKERPPGGEVPRQSRRWPSQLRGLQVYFQVSRPHAERTLCSVAGPGAASVHPDTLSAQLGKSSPTNLPSPPGGRWAGVHPTGRRAAPSHHSLHLTASLARLAQRMLRPRLPQRKTTPPSSSKALTQQYPALWYSHSTRSATFTTPHQAKLN